VRCRRRGAGGGCAGLRSGGGRLEVALLLPMAVAVVVAAALGGWSADGCRGGGVGGSGKSGTSGISAGGAGVAGGCRGGGAGGSALATLHM
jgi:hypothetical protein